MDRASTAVTDPVAAFDAIIAEAVARRNSPAGLYDRLHGLLASTRVAAMGDQQILAQSRKFVSGDYRASVERRYEARRLACKSLRRRIDRLVKRGEV